ncbi:MAG TPA: NAD(P)/FAD-dependent oxidoreductase [Eoetvoesiella sp.]
MNSISHKIVIVGGGAGGLELAAKMGRKFGPKYVFLVDKDSGHIWKPSLHEVAAGTLDIHREGLSYAMLAKDCGFTFIVGEVKHVDRAAKTIHLLPVLSEGQEIFPSREIGYDTLVLAVGSKSNYFGTPGAGEFAIALDSTAQAERFRQTLLRKLVIADRTKASEPGYVLNIAIVGGGATGVELAAELVEACKNLVYYGLNNLDPVQHIKITLLEGAPRILAALPEKMSSAAQQLLLDRGVAVRTSVKVTSITPDALYDTQDHRYPSDICVWAAGIEAPGFLKDLGLPTNRINQVIVDSALRTSDAAIYAIGDCAQAPWDKEGEFLPARAQVAHQQASFLIPILAARIEGRDVGEQRFKFKDYGSLVSVGHSRGVGSLMGVLSGKSWFVEGLVARLMYMSLHLMHHFAVLGFVRTSAMAIGRLLLKRSAPRVKLH